MGEAIPDLNQDKLIILLTAGTGRDSEMEQTKYQVKCLALLDGTNSYTSLKCAPRA